MKIIIKLIILVAVFAYCFAGIAQGQDRQVLFYQNKQKAIEGNWTFSKSGAMQMEALMKKMSKQHYDVYDDPESNFYTPAESGILFNGLVTTWYINGNMATRAIYHHGIPEGRYERWSYYGNKEVTGSFINGKPDSLWTFYYPNGKILMEVNYKGNISSKHTYPKPNNGSYKPPTKQEVLNNFVNSGFRNPLRWIGFKNNPDGEAKVYNENGDLSMQLNFDTDMRNGTWLYIRDGMKIGEIFYDHDSVTAFCDRYGKNIVEDSSLLAKPGPHEELFYLDRRTAPDDLKEPVAVDEIPYWYEQAPPAYPGGDSAMQVYIASNLAFPEEDEKVKKEGNVGVQFVVAANGQLKDIKISGGLGYGCDEEALRLIKGMPEWIPAQQNGIAVPSYHTVVIPFRLKAKR